MKPPKFASIGEWQDYCRQCISHHTEKFIKSHHFDFYGQYDMWFYVHVINQMHSFVLGDGEYDEEME